VLEVIWVDAACERGWGADPEGTTYRVCTVGVLTSVTKKQICLALQFSETGNHSDVMTIPRGMIREIRKIGVTRGFKC